MKNDPYELSDSIVAAIELSFPPSAQSHVSVSLAGLPRFMPIGDRETVQAAIVVVAKGSLERFEELAELAKYDFRNILGLITGTSFTYPDLSHMELIERYRALRLPIPYTLKGFCN